MIICVPPMLPHRRIMISDGMAQLLSANQPGGSSTPSLRRPWLTMPKSLFSSHFNKHDSTQPAAPVKA